MTVPVTVSRCSLVSLRFAVMYWRTYRASHHHLTDSHFTHTFLLVKLLRMPISFECVGVCGRPIVHDDTDHE